MRSLAVLGLGAALIGCSNATGAGATTSAVALRTSSPETYLLGLDELPLPGFTVVVPSAAVTSADLTGGDQVRLDRLRADHFEAGATVRFFRSVADFANSNGPVDVISTVERFASVAGAGDAFTAEVQREDSAPGATPLSTGPLGDEGHGDLTTANVNGVTAAQTVLVWRTANLVSVLEVHERLSGSPLAHALAIARPQVARQGGATPAPQ